jgi:hypothetical protein
VVVAIVAMGAGSVGNDIADLRRNAISDRACVVDRARYVTNSDRTQSLHCHLSTEAGRKPYRDTPITGVSTH